MIAGSFRCGELLRVVLGNQAAQIGRECWWGNRSITRLVLGNQSAQLAKSVGGVIDPSHTSKSDDR